MASNAVVSGPTAKRVAENVERIRKARQMHQRDLSARLTEVGRPMLSTVISKIERGERRVDVDDLMALSLALNVSPNALLLPPTSSNQTVDLTDAVALKTRTAWQWAEGERTASDWQPGLGVPLAEPGANPALPADEWEAGQEFARRQGEYKRLAQPDERRQASDHRTVQLARNLMQVIQDLVIPEPGNDAKGLAALGRMAWRRYQQLGIELDEIRENLPQVHPGAITADSSRHEVTDVIERWEESAAQAREAEQRKDDGNV